GLRPVVAFFFCLLIAHPCNTTGVPSRPCSAAQGTVGAGDPDRKLPANTAAAVNAGAAGEETTNSDCNPGAAGTAD
ncbi:MAG: hypothetical protein KGL39_10830, partial [Patescibacteria group bacterium]|nr:hypothetical protein [Patescibacteria group bacterium]